MALNKFGIDQISYKCSNQTGSRSRKWCILALELRDLLIFAG